MTFFYAIARGLSIVGFPWQIMVLLMSFLLILSESIVNSEVTLDNLFQE